MVVSSKNGPHTTGAELFIDLVSVGHALGQFGANESLYLAKPEWLCFGKNDIVEFQSS
jgi:hypothetical protein